MSGLSEQDRAHARRVAAAMGPWTDEALAELARIVDAAPPPVRDQRRADAELGR